MLQVSKMWLFGDFQVGRIPLSGSSFRGEGEGRVTSASPESHPGVQALRFRGPPSPAKRGFSVLGPQALFWAWVLLAIVIYAFAIFTTRVLGKAPGQTASGPVSAACGQGECAGRRARAPHPSPRRRTPTTRRSGSSSATLGGRGRILLCSLWQSVACSPGCGVRSGGTQGLRRAQQRRDRLPSRENLGVQGGTEWPRSAWRAPDGCARRIGGRRTLQAADPRMGPRAGARTDGASRAPRLATSTPHPRPRAGACSPSSRS